MSASAGSRPSLNPRLTEATFELLDFGTMGKFGERRESVDKDFSFEVIDFMLPRPGSQSGDMQLHRFPLQIVGFDRHFLGSPDFSVRGLENSDILPPLLRSNLFARR